MRRILSIYEKRNAVQEYRNFRMLENCGHQVTFVDKIIDNKKRQRLDKIAESLYKKGDIWFVKYISNNNFLNVIMSAKQYLKSIGKEVTLVVDQDDNVFKIPMGNAAMFFWQAGRLEKQSQLIASADWVVVSTEPLKNDFKMFNENIIVIPNMVKLEDWKPRQKRGKIKIGWVFSNTHVPDINECSDALKEILEEFPDVEMQIMGGDKTVFPFKFKPMGNCKFENYAEKLCKLNWDIAIGPLRDNEFNKSKSNIKWMEASLAGSAFVASKVYPYDHSIKDGKTGFLCGNKKQWKNALRKLIQSKELRKEIVANAQEVVKGVYNIDDHLDTIYNFYENV